MPLKIQCVCGQTMSVPTALVGQSVKCPACGARTRVAVAETAPDRGRPGEPPLMPPPRAHPAPPASIVLAEAAAPARTPAKLPETLPSSPAGTPPRPPPEQLSPESAPLRPEQATLPGAHAVGPEEVVGDPIMSAASVNADSAAAGAIRAAPAPGYTPHRRQVSTLRSLAVGLSLVSLIGMVPAAFELAGAAAAGFPSSLRAECPAWVSLLAFVSLLQFAYALYLWHLPDWGAALVVTVVTLVLSVGYATVLGATYVSGADGWFVNLLQLADRLPGGWASGWCFIMLCLTSLISYLSGQSCLRWHDAVSPQHEGTASVPGRRGG